MPVIPGAVLLHVLNNSIGRSPGPCARPFLIAPKVFLISSTETVSSFVKDWSERLFLSSIIQLLA